LVAKVVRLY